MADEFICDTHEVREFITKVKEIMAKPASVAEWTTSIRPIFSHLLADPDWLPQRFRRTYEAGGMGKGIANWLLYRDTNGSLSLSVLVLPPGKATPIHDHLAWGLVGLYVGEQDEEVFEPASPVASDDTQSDLQLVSKDHLKTGSFYELIPPSGDIHRVITTSDEPSISIHLLGNDVGCISRHRFELEKGEVIPFRSGYTNQDCEAAA